MKKFLLLSLFTLLASVASAKTEMDNINVKINFNYSHNKQTDIIDADMRMVKNDSHWTVIQNNEKDGNIVLLSQVEKLDTNSATIKFVILDVGKNPSIVSKTKMIVALEQEGKIKMKAKNGEIELSVRATV